MSHMSPASLRVSLNASLATPLSVSLAFALAGNLALTAVMPAHAQTTIVSPKNNLSVTEMEELYVSGRVVINPTLSTAIPKNASTRPPADGGDFLRSLPGIDGSRMGGHGIDPVIRGQSRSQLNIINNGAYSFNGCPNRMDPPTSYSDIQTTDIVIVQRGYQSVQHGAGGSGGTVIFEHKAPTFKEGKSLKAQISGGLESNGDIWSLAGDVAGDIGVGHIRATGHLKDAENYEDGRGVDVRSAFKQYGGSLETGLKNEQNNVVIGLEYDRIEDALFAGAGMDSPESERLTIRAKAEHQFEDAGLVEALHLNLYLSDIDHVMDNFSLRDRMMMFRRADTESLSYGGKLVADLVHDDVNFNIGTDIQIREMDGLRTGNNMTSNMDMFYIQSFIIPDTKIEQFGLFVEGTKPISADLKLKSGLRYDYVHASLDKAHLPSTMMTFRSANDLYQKYYGQTARNQNEHNISGLFRLEYSLSNNATAYLGISRSTRTADATERSIASDMGNAPTANRSWVGNPDLAPEKHYQIDAGYGLRQSNWSFLLSAYYDRIDDYILRDTARGQTGVLVADGANIYRNIDATLWGVELEAQMNLLENLLISGNAAYTYGQNKELDIPLAQIPPLSGKVSLAYTQSVWELGAHLRWAVKQTRVDADVLTGSGRDTGKTPGYAVIDLSGKYQVTEQAVIRLGISNLFDKTYANHLNRENLNDGSVVQVNEPGRAFYLKMQFTL